MKLYCKSISKMKFGLRQRKFDHKFRKKFNFDLKPIIKLNLYMKSLIRLNFDFKLVIFLTFDFKCHWTLGGWFDYIQQKNWALRSPELRDIKSYQPIDTWAVYIWFDSENSEKIEKNPWYNTLWSIKVIWPSIDIVGSVMDK